MEDRELVLSLYLDGELDAEQALAVEEKLRSDEMWQADYQTLLASEKRVSKAVQNNWHDAEFTERVMEEVKARSTSTASAAWAANLGAALIHRAHAEGSPLQRMRWGWRALAAAAALLLLGAGLTFLSYRRPAPPAGETAPRHVASFDRNAARLGTDSLAGLPDEPGNLYSGQSLAALQVSTEPTRVRWNDGSVIWLGPGAAIRDGLARGFTLACGAVLVEAAPQAEAFKIELPDGSAVAALGTRFELDSGAERIRVRVLEGHVRRSGPTGQTAEARGGQVIEPDFQVRAFDPREISLHWNGTPDSMAALDAADSRPALAAPWPQLGGSPGHTGVTPLAGPAGMAATRFFAFPPRPAGSFEAPTHYAPAVIGAHARVFLLRRAEGDTTQLFMLEFNLAAPEWKPCGPPLLGNTQHSPVVTPKGLVVVGTTGRTVQAWDPQRRASVWSRDVGSSVYALCAAYDGSILCSTEQGLVALDERGEKQWSYQGLTNLQAPACVTPDGTVIAVSRAGDVAVLKRDRQQLLPVPAKAGEGGYAWPPVAQDESQAWIASHNGALWKASLSTDLSFSQIFEAGSKLSTWPLATGVFALGNSLHTQRNRVFIKTALPIQGEISALAADGSGCVYAALKDKIYRLKPDRQSGDVHWEHSAAKQGEVVQGGIAIIPGRLIVTTTEGIQIFE